MENSINIEEIMQQYENEITRKHNEITTQYAKVTREVNRRKKMERKKNNNRKYYQQNKLKHSMYDTGFCDICNHSVTRQGVAYHFSVSIRHKLNEKIAQIKALANT